MQIQITDNGSGLPKNVIQKFKKGVQKLSNKIQRLPSIFNFDMIHNTYADDDDDEIFDDLLIIKELIYKM